MSDFLRDRKDFLYLLTSKQSEISSSESYKRNEYKSTFAHENVMRTMKTYLMTYIVNDAIEEHFTVWSNRRKTWLNFTMKTTWCNMKNRLKKKAERRRQRCDKQVTHARDQKNKSKVRIFCVIDWRDATLWRDKWLTFENHENNQKFRQITLFLESLLQCWWNEETMQSFLDKRSFVCFKICSTIQINLFQSSSNHVYVQWIFVDV
jgi:hypothetical protein